MVRDATRNNPLGLEVMYCTSVSVVDQQRGQGTVKWPVLC